MNKALYRKYKPQNFSELIGQYYIKKILKNSLKNNMVSHAYIFSGPRGIGKTSVAWIFSKAINCLDLKNGDACLKCNNCIFFNSNDCMDIIELDAASNSGISEIRNLIDSTKFIPNIFNKKIYIIDEAHMLTNNSWNALLKTLEDPPKNVIFIFATTEVNKIPLTILSRCQRFDFERISDENLNEFIKQIIIKENIKIDDEAIDKIISISEGSVRDCLSILNQVINFSNDIISLKTVNEIFGLLDVDSKLHLINLILKKDIVSISNLINEFELMGINFYKLTFQLIEILLDKLFYIKSNSFANLKILNQKNINFFSIPSNKILNLIEILQNGIIQIKNNIDDKFFFELIMLNCISFLNKDENSTFVEEEVNEVNMSENDFKKIDNLKEKLDDSIDSKLEEITPKIISNKDVDDLKYSEVKFEDVVKSRKFEFEKKEDKAFLKNLNNAPYVLKELEINNPINNSIEKPQFNNNNNNNNNNNVNEINDDLILNELDKNLTKYFSEIAFNNNKEIKSKLNIIFDDIRGKIPRTPEEAYINDALKILIASNNGFVLLFDDDYGALNLNLVTENENFLIYIKNKFHKIYKVIGVSKKQAREFSEFVKKLKVNYKSYPDVNIEKLKLKIKANASTQEIALEIFGEELGN